MPALAEIRQFRPSQHTQSDHHGILPVKTAGVTRRGSGRDYLGKKHAAKQDQDFIQLSFVRSSAELLLLY